MSTQHADWHLPSEFRPFNDAIIGLATISLLTNILLCIQFWKKRQYIGVSTASLIQMCFFDILLGFFSIIINSAHHVSPSLPWLVCQLDGIAATVLMGASALTLLVLGIERYLHIVRGKPATSLELTCLMACVWVLSIAIAFLPILTGAYYVPQAQVIYCLNDYTQRTPAHLIYSISTLCGVICINVAVTWIYYSIYNKAISDGFKWNTDSFVMKSVVARYLYSKFGDSNCNRTENGTSGELERAIPTKQSRVKLGETTSELGYQKNEAYKKQMELTIKLALFTLYVYFCWFGMIASWTYQLITANKVSPAIDFTVSLIPFCGNIMNPIFVLIIDNRFKYARPLWWKRLRKQPLVEDS
ncbi:hypothetical protein BKA69DRAFT_1068332 [Paraphysoderma sedebokerense]|nr:hypothetical protein BKA69DRAFT_1068332 [Paraphysoderma sedebokerense]